MSEPDAAKQKRIESARRAREAKAKKAGQLLAPAGPPSEAPTLQAVEVVPTKSDYEQPDQDEDMMDVFMDDVEDQLPQEPKTKRKPEPSSKNKRKRKEKKSKKKVESSDSESSEESSESEDRHKKKRKSKKHRKSKKKKDGWLSSITDFTMDDETCYAVGTAIAGVVGLIYLGSAPVVGVPGAPPATTTPYPPQPLPTPRVSGLVQNLPPPAYSL